MSAGRYAGLPGSARGGQPLWHRVSAAAGLVAADGSVEQTIFGQMTQLAAAHDAVNLGQGAPGDDAPDFLLQAAQAAMRAGRNQYAPPQGAPELRAAVAEHRLRDWGHAAAAEEVLVTTGATEALTAALLALAPAGSEVVVLEPYYDSYAAAAALAGARVRPVGLRFDGPRPEVDLAALAQAVGRETSVVLLNTPHNPTGLVLSEADIRRVWEIVEPSGAWLLTDEVYEHLVFEGAHTAPAAVIGDPRVVTVSSAGKALNATGWKVGWLIGAPAVVQAVQAIKQFLTFVSGAPLQPAVAEALRAHPGFPAENARILAARRDVLVAALRELPGVDVFVPASGYFVLADFAGAAAGEDAAALNARLTREAGVTGIPAPALCQAGSATAERLRSVVRYSFCKSEAEVARAADRFRAYAAGGTVSAG
ncbi:aminotransferase class I/II-fold pyridoxal phosphate-dependent enzyme [Brevibacterium album]|uniref:aminotransferase class I/II-fold pyridoxal phosphate-dependent enzyme n=1 Tax=Brevibacterium album TaxID=417948 RepID=UPI00040A85D6|nr:aminotransferase class I/II-fold pyridoxal phosphate-dependent enzyme [Brevibacterium album]